MDLLKQGPRFSNGRHQSWVAACVLGEKFGTLHHHSALSNLRRIISEIKSLSVSCCFEYPLDFHAVAVLLQDMQLKTKIARMVGISTVHA